MRKDMQGTCRQHRKGTAIKQYGEARFLKGKPQCFSLNPMFWKADGGRLATTTATTAHGMCSGNSENVLRCVERGKIAKRLGENR